MFTSFPLILLLSSPPCTHTPIPSFLVFRGYCYIYIERWRIQRYLLSMALDAKDEVFRTGMEGLLKVGSS